MNNRSSAASLAFSALRVFSWIVLALMLVSMLYAGWISLVNWTDIRV